MVGYRCVEVSVMRNALCGEDTCHPTRFKKKNGRQHGIGLLGKLII